MTPPSLRGALERLANAVEAYRYARDDLPGGQGARADEALKRYPPVLEALGWAKAALAPPTPAEEAEEGTKVNVEGLLAQIKMAKECRLVHTVVTVETLNALLARLAAVEREVAQGQSDYAALADLHSTTMAERDAAERERDAAQAEALRLQVALETCQDHHEAHLRRCHLDTALTLEAEGARLREKLTEARAVCRGLPVLVIASVQAGLGAAEIAEKVTEALQEFGAEIDQALGREG